MGMYMTIRRVAPDALSGVDDVADWVMNGDDLDTLELDKGWDLVGRYLADDDPTGLMAWGSPLAGDGYGYGPPLRVGDGDLRDLHARLGRCSDDDIARWVASPSAAEAYPLMGRAIDEGVVEWLRDLVHDLRSFVHTTVERGDVLVMLVA